MSIFDRFLPKKKPLEIKNNIPKEKETMKKAFGIYCHKNHGTKDDKLCPKCTALLATVMTKMNRCPYGITKPICDRCEIQCFGEKQTKEFMKIMSSTGTGMFFRHPIMSIKHKMASMSVDYSKHEMEKKQQEKAKHKEKLAKEKAKAKEASEKKK